jgi:polynucleotide 5'-kinase involved in rRNA processing
MPTETNYIDLLKECNSKVLEQKSHITSIVNKRKIIINDAFIYLSKAINNLEFAFFKLTQSLSSNSIDKYIDHLTPFSVINVCYDISKNKEVIVALISIDNTNFVLYFTPPTINKFNFSGENVTEYVIDIIKIDFATHTDVSLYFYEYKKQLNADRN